MSRDLRLVVSFSYCDVSHELLTLPQYTVDCDAVSCILISSLLSGPLTLYQTGIQVLKLLGILTHAQIKNRRWEDVGRALGKRGKDYRDRCVELQKSSEMFCIHHIVAPNVFVYPTLVTSSRQLVVLCPRNWQTLPQRSLLLSMFQIYRKRIATKFVSR